MQCGEVATALLRGLHVAASLSLFGCLVFRTFVVPRRVAGAADLKLTAVHRITAVSAVLALIFGGAWLAAVSGTIAGANGPASLFNAIPLVARHTNFGHLACARLVLLAGVPLLLACRASGARPGALFVTGAAIALQPLLGHIGASAGRAVLVPIEIAHLLAAGAWFGSLLPLLLCVMRAPVPLAGLLCERFTPVGLVAVGTIAVTALPQAGELIGGLPGLFGTQYGHMALIKLGLFFLALGLACLNRLVLTVRLGTGLARRALVGSIAVEAVAVFGVVLAAGAMASSPPAAHVQPVWPFPWRPGLDAWYDPESHGKLVRLLIATAAGSALIGISLGLRRFRFLAACLAALLVAPFTPVLDRLLVAAYPTSYARSTTEFSAASIARGQALFGPLCAACHDPSIGSGGAADLTAPHIWGHLDGELVWRVMNGVTDPHGAALMPAFAAVLSEDDLWALIDFIHARNVGRQATETGTWSPPVFAPATPLNCDGETVSLADLAHDLLVVADAAPAPVGPGSIPGVETIRLARETDATPAEGTCVTSAPAAWEAWRVLSGVAPDRFGGYQAIVDRQGWLRAWLPPGSRTEQILAAVRDARDHPIAAGAAFAGAHHH